MGSLASSPSASTQRRAQRAEKARARRAESPAPLSRGERHRELARKALGKYLDDPVAFYGDFFGETDRRTGIYTPARLWWRQVEILRAVAAAAAELDGRPAPKGSVAPRGRRRIAVKSGHKIGKSRLAAIIALWWWCTRKEGRVVLTSASGHQIKNILWREIRILYGRARVKLGGVLARDPGTGLQAADGRDILGIATNEPERMAGISSPRLLYILDEGSGIDDAILEAIKGNIASGGMLVAFSNPTRPSGWFFDAFNGRADQWIGFTVSSEEAAAVEPPIKGLARADWVEEIAAEEGRDSPFFDVRVRGNFPTQASNAVVSLHLVEEGVKRWREVVARAKGDGAAPAGRLVAGVDVSRFGDDETTRAFRRGKVILSLAATRNEKSSGDADRQVRDFVLEGIVEERRHGDGAPLVNVDVTGLGAAAYALLEQVDGLEVVPVHAQDDATANDNDGQARFGRMRDQLWWGIRDFLREGGAIPDDPKLRAELIAPIYRLDARGRIVVESKDDTKAKIGRSPDRADACCLCVYEGGASNAEMVIGDRTKLGRARFADDPRPFDGPEVHRTARASGDYDWADLDTVGDDDD